MEILGKLFGSDSKVKLMRLFLFNPDMPFTKEDVAARAKISVPSARHELGILRKMKLIRGRTMTKRILRRGQKNRFMRKRAGGWILDASFPYLQELRRLLLNTSLLKGEEITKKLSSAGRLKLVIIAGIFIQNLESRLDILVVGDHLRRGAVLHKIKAMESEIGKELRYAAFETSEFNYRLGLYDKLVRDVLDYPHLVVLDRLGLPPVHVGRR